MRSSNNLIQRFSAEILISFLLFFLSVNAASPGDAAMPVCGKVLVAKMYDICQTTDCNTVTPITAETYAPFDLLTECCLQGCEASRIEQYCCFVPSQIEHGSPFQPRVALAQQQQKVESKRQQQFYHHKFNRFNSHSNNNNFNPFDLGY